MKLIDLTGQRFGRLTVIKYIGKSKWQCKCDCGNIVNVCRGNLRSHGTQSCGCLQKERTSSANNKHGFGNSKIYKIACSIIQRCTNPNNSAYPNYGGRGVRIYPYWRDNPGAFAKWLLDNGWYDGCDIDKDIKGNPEMPGYFPNTISFVSRVENMNHRRATRYIEYKGEQRSLTEWCKVLNLPYSTISNRYYHRRWRDPIKLFETPIRVQTPINITYKGETKLLKDWCHELNLDYKQIYNRYHTLGWRDPADLFEIPVQVGNNQTSRGDKN